MPEGHSVARWAASLAVLVDEPVLALKAPKRWAERAAALVGQRLVATESRGKHLLLHFSDGTVIHSHAMLYGSWQIGEPGMELRKAERFVRLRIRTPGHEAVFFHGPVVELLTPEEVAAHPTLDTLGPDVLTAAFDYDEAFARVHAQGEREIGDTLLDQRVVAGIGNVFKSEALFLAGLDPFRASAGLSRAEVDRIWDAVIPIMRDAVARWGATTTLPPELHAGWRRNWVYKSSRKPCLRCGDTIASRAQGEFKRRTFYCPTCQHVAGSAPPAAKPAKRGGRPNDAAAGTRSRAPARRTRERSRAGRTARAAAPAAAAPRPPARSRGRSRDP